MKTDVSLFVDELAIKKFGELAARKFRLQREIERLHRFDHGKLRREYFRTHAILVTLADL